MASRGSLRGTGGGAASIDRTSFAARSKPAPAAVGADGHIAERPERMVERRAWRGQETQGTTDAHGRRRRASARHGGLLSAASEQLQMERSALRRGGVHNALAEPS